MRTPRSTPTSFDFPGQDCFAWFLSQAYVQVHRSAFKSAIGGV
jgi:hypothetical protein